MNGIILIDKPSGWTSFDVVAVVRGILNRSIKNELKINDSSSKLPVISKKIKVGHTGTLDPLATGLLVMVVGDYCKRAQEFSQLNKRYEVTMTLGQTSSTDDGEGQKTIVSSLVVTKSKLQSVFEKFKGEIMQTPPVYSAIKINGQRAYKLARQGQKVSLQPRKVIVSQLTITNYQYPIVNFSATVSSGTYIRSLVKDIGVMLTTGAYMSGLVRTDVGPYNIIDALKMADLNPESITSNLLTKVQSSK